MTTQAAGSVATTLIAVAPFTPPPVALALVIGAGAIGLGIGLKIGIEKLKSRNKAERVQGARDIRTIAIQINQARPSTWSEQATADFQADAIRESAWNTVVEIERRMLASVDTPTFSSFAEAGAWFADISRLFQSSEITGEAFSAAQDWYNLEIARLIGQSQAPTQQGSAGAAPPPVVASGASPAPAGPITVNVPPANITVLPAPVSVDLGPLSGIIQGLPGAISQGFDFGVGRPIAAAIGGLGVGSMAYAIGNTLTSSAGLRAHNAQMARYECQSSFVPFLMNSANRLLPTAITAGALFDGSPLRTFADKFVASIVNTQLAIDRYGGVATEEGVEARASERILEAMRFGLQAQMVSYSAEAISPLKQMGFAQFAGVLGKFAGFERMADGLHGVVESAAIYTPLRWRANRHYRPTLPNDAVIAPLFAKGLITAEQARDYQERAGVPDVIIDKMPELWYRDPSLLQISRFLQLQDINDSQLTGFLKRAQIDPREIPTYITFVRMGSVRREHGARLAVIDRMYRGGFMTRDRAVKRLQETRKPMSWHDTRIQLMDEELELDEKEDRKEIALRSLSKGLASEEEVTAELQGLGMSEGFIDRAIMRERLGMIPQARLAPAIDVADELIEIGGN